MSIIDELKKFIDKEIYLGMPRKNLSISVSQEEMDELMSECGLVGTIDTFCGVKLELYK